MCQALVRCQLEGQDFAAALTALRPYSVAGWHCHSVHSALSVSPDRPGETADLLGSCLGRQTKALWGDCSVQALGMGSGSAATSRGRGLSLPLVQGSSMEPAPDPRLHRTSSQGSLRSPDPRTPAAESPFSFSRVLPGPPDKGPVGRLFGPGAGDGLWQRCDLTRSRAVLATRAGLQYGASTGPPPPPDILAGELTLA